MFLLTILILLEFIKLLFGLNPFANLQLLSDVFLFKVLIFVFVGFEPFHCDFFVVTLWLLWIFHFFICFLSVITQYEFGKNDEYFSISTSILSHSIIFQSIFENHFILDLLYSSCYHLHFLFLTLKLFHNSDYFFVSDYYLFMNTYHLYDLLFSSY